MKKFSFKLKGLLRIKEALEKDVKRQLAEIQNLCRQKQGQIDETDRKVEEWSVYYNKVIGQRVHATELAVIDAHLGKLSRFKEQLAIGLEILGRKRDDLTRYYTEVRREVEMLHHLKDKKLAEYREEMRREDEKLADEMATLRAARERISV